ncbi:MAG: DUF998 domain-containing protein [Nocardioides sp.]
MTWLRTAQVVATVSVACFWGGVVVAGALAEGYSARDDVISSLAGRGSSVAVLGVASILSLAPAHLAGARVLTLVHRSRIAAGLLLAAAAATALIAVFRVSCPTGAAGCAQVASEADVADLVHGLAVTAYELVIFAAMIAVAARAVRTLSSWPRWMAVVSVAAALGSVALLVRTGGDEAGLWQRLWVGTNLGWLLLVTWLGPVRTPAPEGGPPPRH